MKVSVIMMNDYPYNVVREGETSEAIDRARMDAEFKWPGQSVSVRAYDFEVEPEVVAGCSCGAKFYSTAATDDHECPLDEKRG